MTVLSSGSTVRYHSSVSVRLLYEAIWASFSVMTYTFPPGFSLPTWYVSLIREISIIGGESITEHDLLHG